MSVMAYRSRRHPGLGSLGFAILIIAGCGKVEQIDNRRSADHEHVHEALFGGVVVPLGNDEFHLEFVLGSTSGVLQAYVLDEHLENFVRIDLASFAANARVDASEYALEFVAVADSASGETVGDSALFEARADWLVNRPGVELTVPTISIKGRTYTAVTASVPAAAHSQSAE